MSLPDGGPPPPERAGLRMLARDLLSFDRRALAVLVYAPIALAVMEFVFVRQKIPAAVEALESLRRAWPSVPRDLWRWLWWGAGCLVVQVAVPLVLLRVVAGARPRDTGIRLKGTLHDARVYLFLLVVFWPVVWLVSRSPEFQATYPFYPRTPPGGRPRVLGLDYLAFELAYFAQFFAVEYFFRGFLVLGLKPVMGRLSVLVMLAPYCMIHFYKPMPEALGSIGAGLVLGCLSWRTGTVIYGWFLHYAIALSMDLLALHNAGLLRLG